MATLYDLELQESNNFIHLLLKEGESASLKLFRDQMEMSAQMGPAGAEIVNTLKDPKTDMGKSYKRLEELEKATKEAMAKAGMTAAIAQKASDILTKKPLALSDISEDDQKAVEDYWIKKKMCVALLVQMGYTYQEMYS